MGCRPPVRVFTEVTGSGEVLGRNGLLLFEGRGVGHELCAKSSGKVWDKEGGGRRACGRVCLAETGWSCNQTY